MKALDAFKLNGKVAIVTGGAGVLGPHFAAALAEAGARVVIADYNRKEGARTAADISKRTGVKAEYAWVDVSDPSAVRDLVSQTAKRHKRIDILINAAIGAGKRHFGPMESYSWDDWNHVMRVTVGGTFLCCQEAGKVMKRQRGGVIINLGSIYGVVGADQRIYGNSGINSPAVYAASKGAIINLTRYLAVYWAPFNIRVNAVSPGGVYNKQPAGFVKKYSSRTPLGRMLKREELKATMLYLASDASSYVTGQNLLVDGGWTAW